MKKALSLHSSLCCIIFLFYKPVYLELNREGMFHNPNFPLDDALSTKTQTSAGSQIYV